MKISCTAHPVISRASLKSVIRQISSPITISTVQLKLKKKRTEWKEKRDQTADAVTVLTMTDGI